MISACLTERIGDCADVKEVVNSEDSHQKQTDECAAYGSDSQFFFFYSDYKLMKDGRNEGAALLNNDTATATESCSTFIFIQIEAVSLGHQDACPLGLGE